MRLLDRTLPTLIENLALDEALLVDAEAGAGDVLRFWEWADPAVVLGAGGQRHAEVDIARCRKTACRSCVAPAAAAPCFSARDVCFTASFSAWTTGPSSPTCGRPTHHRRADDDRLRRSRGKVDGQSDLVLDGRKFSGNAQQRKRTHLLHHGTILYAFDVSRIGDYVKHPPRMPEYRDGPIACGVRDERADAAERIKIRTGGGVAGDGDDVPRFRRSW